MAAPDTVASTLRGELLGLKTNIALATTGVVSKTTGNVIRMPNVRNRTYTGLYMGPWPLIQIRWDGYRIDLITGGKPPLVGQHLTKPSLYSLEFMDAVPPKSTPASEAVGNAEDDLIDLFDAVVGWFNYLPNRCLPVTINNVITPMAKYVGLPMLAHGMAPFTEEGDGMVRVVLAAAIGVQGIPQKGTT